MRFDDMLATLLAQPAPTSEARAILWRQVVDVLAQGRGHHVDDPLVDAPRAMDAYNFLRSVRPEIPVDLRLAAGRGLIGRRVPPELVLLFAEDLPHIAAPMLGNVLLSTPQWLDLLPRLNPSARNLLRNRRDLGSEVEQALEGFGSSDFLIPGPSETPSSSLAPLATPIEALVANAQAEASPPAAALSPAAPTVSASQPVEEIPAKAAELESLLTETATPSASESQIRDLLSRIETFRARYPHVTPADGVAAEPGAPAAGSAPIENFRFETGVDGVISWVQGAPRGPLIGETIAVAARQTDHGVDAHAAGAYRSRTPFRDARLTIAGEGPASGEWRISAVPFFDQKDGRFSGYRGTARRPRADESATALTAARSEPDPVRNDSLRQLAHELRTPLNAIIGFSEMIEQQVRGPAAAAYRSRAQEILEQSKKLLSAVEDLDLVATARVAETASAPAPIDAASILTRLHANFEEVAAERASGLAFRIDSTLPPVAVDGPTVERMLSRLLAATIAMAGEGERISVDLQRDPRRSTHLLLTIMRPRALFGRDEKMLLDPGYNPDGNWPDAPVLGLGFALRLVRNLAIASGGMLEIDATRFHLSLPLRDGGRAEQDAM